MSDNAVLAKFDVCVLSGAYSSFPVLPSRLSRAILKNGTQKNQDIAVRLKSYASVLFADKSIFCWAALCDL